MFNIYNCCDEWLKLYNSNEDITIEIIKRVCYQPLYDSLSNMYDFGIINYKTLIVEQTNLRLAFELLQEKIYNK